MQLLLVSVGPVQDFIASARRCQDLWFGSWLLSSLARAAARGIQEAAGQEDCLIFPGSLDDDERKPAVSNKILARIDRSPRDVANAGREAMNQALEAITKVAFAEVKGPHFRRDIAERQVRDLMEYVWVSAPIGEGGYGPARRVAERLLGARKMRRGWKPVTWGAMVPKSSLDGLRESVLDEDLYEAIASGGISAENARRRYFVKPTERLCGVGLLKRVGTEVEGDDAILLARRPTFHSTSHVASAPVRARLRQLARTDVFEPYRATLEKQLGRNLCAVRADARELAGLDGRSLYEGQLEAILAENAPDLPPKGKDRADRVESVRKVLRQCLRQADMGVEDVPTYYAVLLADGDFMGKTLDEVGDRHGEDGQRHVAAALDAFSGRCEAIVRAHDGSLIYAGGDDLLALLPLHTVLGCARALNEEFRLKMESVLAQMSIPSQPSLSVGVGISHHLDDMAEARELAKKAEAKAKALAGKNALAVIAQLRSGGRLEAVGSFSASDPLDERLAGWVGHLVRDEIPGKVAHDLAAQLSPLIHGGAASLDGELFKSLAKRLFGRKRADRGEAPLGREVTDKLDAIFARSGAAEALHALVDELQIASLLATAYDVATPDLPARSATPATVSA